MGRFGTMLYTSLEGDYTSWAKQWSIDTTYSNVLICYWSINETAKKAFIGTWADSTMHIVDLDTGADLGSDTEFERVGGYYILGSQSITGKYFAYITYNPSDHCNYLKIFKDGVLIQITNITAIGVQGSQILMSSNGKYILISNIPNGLVTLFKASGIDAPIPTPFPIPVSEPLEGDFSSYVYQWHITPVGWNIYNDWTIDEVAKKAYIGGYSDYTMRKINLDNGTVEKTNNFGCGSIGGPFPRSILGKYFAYINRDSSPDEVWIEKHGTTLQKITNANLETATGLDLAVTILQTFFSPSGKYLFILAYKQASPYDNVLILYKGVP